MFRELPKFSDFKGKIFEGDHPVPYSVYVLCQISWYSSDHG